MRLWVGVVCGLVGALLALIYALRPVPDIVTLAPGAFRAAYLIPNPDVGTVEVYITIQSGEIDNPYTPGLAHYVEHLAWLNAVGATDDLTERDTNAWTNAEATVYMLAVPADSAAKAIATLAKIFDPFTLDQTFMLSERDILQREYDLRMGENPMAARYQAMMARLHAADPRARSVLGTAADIAAMRLPDAVALHAATHRPGNAVLVVYGGITAANAQVLADRVSAMAAAPPAPPRRYIAAPIADLQSAGSVALVAQPQVLAAKVVALPDPVPRAVLQVQLAMLHMILTSSLPGSLAKPLRYDAQLAQGFDLSLIDLTDQAVEVGFYARPDTGVAPGDLLAAYDATLARIAAEGVPQVTFDRLHRRWMETLAMEPDPSRVTLQLALQAAAQRLPMQSHAQFVELAAAVTRDQMTALLRAITAPGRRAVDIVTPE